MPVLPVTRSASARRVLDVALELFIEQGYEGTSLQQIADRLGVTKAAVYYHFRSKNDLLAALVDPVFDEMDSLLSEAEALPRDTARQKLALHSLVEHLLRHRRTATWMRQDAAAVTGPVFWQRAHDIERRLGDLLTLGGEDALARLWTRAMVQAISGVVLTEQDADDQWLRTEVAELSSYLLAGYRAARRRQRPCEPPPAQG